MSSIRSLIALFVICAGISASAAEGGAPPREGPAIALLSDAECWKKLPPAETGAGQPLPSWARALAGPMPRTTAALLRLDWVHRTRSPLDPKLRAEMRLVAAQANRCAYAEAYAAFDARLAGLSDAALSALRRGQLSEQSSDEKAALAFARKMTLNSASVTDDEFAALLRAYGEKQVVAMVLLLAPTLPGFDFRAGRPEAAG
jgi:alkylhydroperoxidase family enzyme